MRVLVAEDDPVAAELVTSILREESYDVIHAEDGSEALKVLRSTDVRLVVADWEMPRLTGVELCRRVRTGEVPRYVYVILVTGRDSIDDRVAGLSAGADDFVSKPFDPVELSLRIKAARRVLSVEGRDVAIFAMAKLAETRDQETGCHLERVRNYTALIARSLGETPAFAAAVNPEFVEQMYQTSPLHDIGKIGIPDAVLRKPGKLLDAEHKIMQTHTTIGARTLEAALAQFPDAGFLKMARDIALTHHEKFDGTGYPERLKGRDIPLEGRIMAVADVYDALTTERVYKPAFPHDQAVAMIVRDAGSHFDPDVVAAFQRIVRDIERTRAHLADELVKAA